MATLSLVNRICVAALVLLFGVGCRHSDPAARLYGTWIDTKSHTVRMAFDHNGHYQIQAVLSGTDEGTYVVQGDRLIATKTGQPSITFDISWTGDQLNLRPEPPKGTPAADATPELLDAFTIHLTKEGNAEHLDPKVPMPAPTASGEIPPGRGDCISHVKQLALATIMYAQDYDEVLPSVNWEDALQPYVRSKDTYSCPAVVDAGGVGGYAFNQDLPGMQVAKITDPANTAIIFDTRADGPNALATLNDAPSPSRDPKGNSIGYLDGHVSSQP